MTDIKLLPLYAELQGHPKLEIVKHYARANVEHHTAAKDAEIEALRAEVRDLRRRQAGWERHVAAAGCEYVRDGEHDALVNRRAERLAEAIRAYKAECDNPAKDYVLRAKRRDEMFALLRDHDQEGKDA